MKIEIKYKISQEQINTIGSQEILLSNEIDVINASRSQFGLLELTPLGIMISSIIMLIYTIRRDSKKESKWTLERLKLVLENELLKADIKEYSTSRITNFQNLVNHDLLKPCIIEIELTSGESIKFRIYYTGSIYKID